MQKIQPTIGRQVWFTPNAQDVKDGMDFRGQPLAATIVFVHNELFINLQVLDAVGNAWTVEEVPLFQDARPWNFEDRSAEWMPYQKAQAPGPNGRAVCTEEARS